MYARITPYCLNNGIGRFILVFGAAVLLYAVAKILYELFVFSLVELFIDKIQFSLFFKLYEIFLFDMIVSVLFNLQNNSTANNWQGTNTVVAIIFGFIILIA